MIFYFVKIIIELQQKNGTWKTIKTWTEQGSVDAFVKGSYRVANKYNYRVAATAKVYNSSGSLVESKTSYSGEVYY